MPNATGRRRHRRLTAAAASVRLVTPQLATESGLPDDTRRCQPAAGPLVAAACSWPDLVRRGQPAGQILAKWPDRPRPDNTPCYADLSLTP
jgi:hypothetical protein